MAFLYSTQKLGHFGATINIVGAKLGSMCEINITRYDMRYHVYITRKLKSSQLKGIRDGNKLVLTYYVILLEHRYFACRIFR